jgi:hypothetical protein
VRAIIGPNGRRVHTAGVTHSVVALLNSVVEIEESS